MLCWKCNTHADLYSHIVSLPIVKICLCFSQTLSKIKIVRFISLTFRFYGTGVQNQFYGRHNMPRLTHVHQERVIVSIQGECIGTEIGKGLDGNAWQRLDKTFILSGNMYRITRWQIPVLHARRTSVCLNTIKITVYAGQRITDSGESRIKWMRVFCRGERYTVYCFVQDCWWWSVMGWH